MSTSKHYYAKVTEINQVKSVDKIEPIFQVSENT